MTRSAMRAPKGSDSPDAVAMPRAFHLLPVAAKTGAATMMPSGMLCTACSRIDVILGCLGMAHSHADTGLTCS